MIDQESDVVDRLSGSLRDNAPPRRIVGAERCDVDDRNLSSMIVTSGEGIGACHERGGRPRGHTICEIVCRAVCPIRMARGGSKSCRTSTPNAVMAAAPWVLASSRPLSSSIFQRGFTESAFPMGGAPMVDAAVNNTVPLIAAAKRAGLPVIACVIGYDTPRAAPLWKAEGVFDLLVGSKPVELDPRIAAAGPDVVLMKSAPSIFFGTSAAAILTKERVDTVIVTGCITSGCIRASVIDAFSLGFRVMVPRDCVGDHDAAAHDQNLKDIERRYGDVIDSATAIAAIEGLRGRNDMPAAEPVPPGAHRSAATGSSKQVHVRVRKGRRTLRSALKRISRRTGWLARIWKGKIALVTGAQQGIGRSIAIAFAEAGADVAINYLDNLDAAKAVAAAVGAFGRRAILVPGDVTDLAACEAMVASTVSGFGGIDILVNNAGVFRACRFWN